MMTSTRRTPSAIASLLSLAIVAVPLVACSAAQSSEPVEQGSEPLLCNRNGPCPNPRPTNPPVPSPQQCAQYACTVSVPITEGSWATATPPYGEADQIPLEQEWTTQVSQGGCEVPGSFQISASPDIPDYMPTTLSYTTCPGTVTGFNSLPGAEFSWSNLMFECNACIAPPRPGWINIAWDTSPAAPAGCHIGVCSGAPVQ